MDKQQPQNLILELSLDFSVALIEYAEQLEAHRKFVIANQILKSGTSIGANVREAQNAESRADFIHKFKIAAKEADETEYCFCSANVYLLIQTLNISRKAFIP